MKYLFKSLSILLFTGSAFFVTAQTAAAQSFTIRTTAYTHSEDDHLVYGKSTASGTQLKCNQQYTSAAADWSRFPLGTKFKIKDEPTIYVVDDYGIALVGTSTIDIYRPSRESMGKWGVRNVEIQILKTGDIKKSRRILKSRGKFGFVKRMHTDMSRG